MGLGMWVAFVDPLLSLKPHSSFSTFGLILFHLAVLHPNNVDVNALAPTFC